MKQWLLANNISSYECERRRGSGKGLYQCKAKVKINENMSVVGYLNERSHGADNARDEMLSEDSIKYQALTANFKLLSVAAIRIFGGFFLCYKESSRLTRFSSRN